MNDTAIKQAGYEDVLAAPANVVAEVIAGVLYTQPRPTARHTKTASELGYELIGPYGRGKGGPGGWFILDEPELHLGPEPDILVPNLAAWKRQRMAEIPDTPFFTLAPDWIGEVLSPSTQAHDRGEKLRIYQREGVHHIWLLDPQALTLEVFRLDGESYRLVVVHTGASRIRAEPFDATVLDLSDLWLHSVPADGQSSDASEE